MPEIGVANAGYCEGQFDSIKIGVCDIYWTPDCGYGQEIFLGLTKGGVEFTYTPEFYDLTVDQYGKTPVDSVLVGETVTVKIPLAETDVNKLSLFAPTSTAHRDAEGNIERLTFGQRPGLRLGLRAGVLRFHPVSMGNDYSEDVTIYRAANKGVLQLNYKLDNETIYEIDVIALIDRRRFNGELLFEIGNPGFTPPPLDFNDPETIIKLPSYTDDFSLSIAPMGEQTLTTQESVSRNIDYIVNCRVFQSNTIFNVTENCTFRLLGAGINTDGNANVYTKTSVNNGQVPAEIIGGTSLALGAGGDPISIAYGEFIPASPTQHSAFRLRSTPTALLVGGSYDDGSGTSVPLAATNEVGVEMFITVRASWGQQNLNVSARIIFNAN